MQPSKKALLFAVLVPLLLLIPALYALTRPLPVEPSRRAAAMDAALAKSKPEVVLIGNSLIGHGVDERALAEALGLPRNKVEALWVPASPSYTWYLVLKNRVYAAGYQPKLVIVAGALPSFFRTDLGSTLMRAGLAEMSGEHEPEIAAKIYGKSASNALYDRFDNRRRKLRDGFADGVRSLSAGLLFGDGQGPLREQGNRVLQPAFAAVFDAEGATDINLHKRMMPMVESETEPVTDEDLSVQGSLIPEIMALTAEHGARLVFVQMPRTAKRMAEEEVAPEIEAEFVALVNGSPTTTYLNMTTLGLADNLFADAGHMNDRGKAKFTAALAEALQNVDALGQGEFEDVRAPLVLPFTATRTGAAPALPALRVTRGQGPCGLVAEFKGYKELSDGALSDARAGVGSPIVFAEEGQPLRPAARKAEVGASCDGSYRFRLREVEIAPHDEADAALKHSFTATLSPDLPHVTEVGEGWWVYPGTELSLSFPPITEDVKRVSVALWVEPIGEDSAGVAASLAGKPLPLEPSGRMLRADATRKTPTEPWTLTLSTPAEGPYLLVRWLHVAVGDRALDLIGDPSRVEAPTLSLLEDGEATVSPPQPALAPIPLELRVVGKIGEADLPALAALSIDRVHERLNCGPCSPVVVYEDGQRLENQKFQPNKIGSAGNYGLFDGVLRFATRDGSPMKAGAHAYTAGLDPSRAAGRSRWLYPGDVATLTPDPKALRGLRDGATLLVVQAWPFGEAEGALSLRLRLGGQDLLRAELPLTQLGDAPVLLPLDAPVPAGAKDLVMEIVSPADGPYVLLGTLDLAERAPEADASEKSDVKVPAEKPKKEKKGKKGGKAGL